MLFFFVALLNALELLKRPLVPSGRGGRVVAQRMLGAQQTALAGLAQFLALAVVFRLRFFDLFAKRADIRQIAGRFVEKALKVGKALLRAVFEAQTLLIHHLADAVARGGYALGISGKFFLLAVHMGGKIADHAADMFVDGIQPSVQGLQLLGVALHGFQQGAQIEGAADGKAGIHHCKAHKHRGRRIRIVSGIM